MLKFGILGIGQGGSNIAEYAYTKGFQAVVVNTAQVDLEQIKYIPNSSKIYLGGMGAGRNREIGMQAMIENAEKILEKCQEEFKECDALFIASTGGGGTGSGGLPVGLEILLSFHKYVGVIIVLPDENESPKAKMNTLECFSQISEFENLGSVLIIDNQRGKQNYDISRKFLYNKVNKEIIDLLIELNELTDQPSYVSNFDACDFLNIIQERGYTLLSKTVFYSGEDDSKFDISKKIRESWYKTCQPIFSDNQIVKAAILGKVPEKISSKVDINIIFQETGIPFDFTDIYFNPDPSSMIDNLSGKIKSQFYTIFSGLEFPQQSLNRMSDSLKNIESKLISSLEKSQTQRFETEQWNNKFQRRVVGIGSLKQDKVTKIDLMSKLTKFK